MPKRVNWMEELTLTRIQLKNNLDHWWWKGFGWGVFSGLGVGFWLLYLQSKN